jgi:hypothetical protein
MLNTPESDDWVTVRTEEAEHDGSRMGVKPLGSLMSWFTARQLCEACIVCRRWKRVADSHPRWCELLKSTGVKVEAADIDAPADLAELGASEGKGAPSAASGPFSAPAAPIDFTGDSASTTTATFAARGRPTCSAHDDWATVTSMPTGTHLAPSECKFIYMMALWVPSNHARAEGESWEQYREYQEYWQQAARAAFSDPRSATRSLFTGPGSTKRVLRITLVGGAVAVMAPVCINGAVTFVFSWWQQPGVMWLIRAVAERMTLGTAAAFGSMGYRHAVAEEDPPEEVVKTTTAAALAGYVSHLAFLRFL